jgi:hypothetical protein
MSSLVVICISSYYRFILLPHYKLVPPQASVAYVQTITSDVARASPQLEPPLVSHICHRSGPDLFLCCHKSIVACASQLCLVVGLIVSYYVNILLYTAWSVRSQSYRICLLALVTPYSHIRRQKLDASLTSRL